MRILLGLLLTLTAAAPLLAQPSQTADLPLAGLETTFEDDFEAGGLAPSWTVWNHYPEVSDGQMLIQGWKSWSDAVLRPNINPSEGVLQLFRYAPGAMEFFLDYGDFGDASYRQLRLGTSGDGNWHVFTAAGSQGVLTRTYGSTQLAPGSWYYFLLLIGTEGNFYIQVWDRENPDEFLMNMEINPGGSGWGNDDWWFGNKVYDGALAIDYFEEVQFDSSYSLPCTVQALGSVNQRSGPGTGHDTVGRLDSGHDLRILAQTVDLDSFTWWQLPDSGWVREDVVRVSGNCEAVPTLAE